MDKNIDTKSLVDIKNKLPNTINNIISDWDPKFITFYTIFITNKDTFSTLFFRLLLFFFATCTQTSKPVGNLILVIMVPHNM